MILDNLILVWVIVANDIIALLPSPDSGTVTFIHWYAPYFRNFVMFNYYWFPVDTLFWMLGSFIAIMSILLIWLAARFFGHLFTFGAVK